VLHKYSIHIHMPLFLVARIPVPLVTRSTLEVVIPPHAAPKLITKSRNKLAQISEVSSLLPLANVQPYLAEVHMASF